MSPDPSDASPAGPAAAPAVALVVNQLRAGGLERIAIDLANTLVGRGVRCAVVSFAPADPAQRQALDPRVGFSSFDKRAGNDVRVVWRLTTFLRRGAFDTLHTHNWGTLVEGFLAGRMAGVGVHLHAEHGTVQTGRLRVAVQRGLMRRVDRVVAVSEAHRSVLTHTLRLAASSVTVVRNGVDTNRFAASPGERDAGRAALGLRHDRVYIGTVGTLRAVKNQAILLHLLTRLRTGHRDPGLVVAGDGPLRAQLQQLAARLGVAGDVTWLGSRPDIPRVLRALDLFVLPSWSEAMPVSLLEAMASALPVVATAVGGIPEVVTCGETGELVPPGDLPALTRAVNGLLAEPERARRLGAAAREWVVAHHSLHEMVSSYLALYQRRGPSGRSRVRETVTRRAGGRRA